MGSTGVAVTFALGLEICIMRAFAVAGESVGLSIFPYRLREDFCYRLGCKFLGNNT